MSYPIDERIHEVARLSRNYYTNLPYHNYSHVESTITSFDHLCDILSGKGVFIPRNIGKAALYMHDANYHENYRNLGFDFDSKEEYSSYLARNMLHTLDVDSNDIDQIIEAIQATDVSVKPDGNTQKAVRYADLGNVYGQSYPEFLRNFLLLQKEAVLLRQPIADNLQEQAKRTALFLESFVVDMTFETTKGEVISLPTEMNFAERNISRLSKLTLQAVTRTVLGFDKLLPEQWRQAA